MEELLKKMSFNKDKAKSYIVRQAAREFSALTEPCYFPKTKKTYFEILDLIKIPDKEFRMFVKDMYKGTKAETWKLQIDPTTNLLVVLMHLFLKDKDTSAYASTMLYYMIIHYARLGNKHFPKFCNPEVFNYALETLTKTHLFFREKTIPNSLFYLSKEMIKNHTKDIARWDVDGIADFIGKSRHRISQSVKSFAQHYYRSVAQGNAIKVTPEQTEDSEDIAYLFQQQTIQRGGKLIDKTVENLVIYKTIDRKALEEAKNLSKIKTSVSDLLIRQMKDRKYSDNYNMILRLFLKELTERDQLCGNKFYDYIRKLMFVKRSKSTVYFKQQIAILVENLVADMNELRDLYQGYTRQTQFAINIFVAFYLTLTLHNQVC
jgi:hypothetical protein